MSDFAVLLSPLWFLALIAFLWNWLGDYLAATVDILYHTFVFYVLWNRHPYQETPSVHSFNSPLITWGFVLLLAIVTCGSLYLLWRYIRTQRCAEEKQYWKSVYSSIRFSLASAILVFSILYGISTIVTTLSRQRSQRRLKPFFTVGEMQAFGRPKDYTTPITYSQLKEYTDHRKSYMTNRIDW